MRLFLENEPQTERVLRDSIGMVLRQLNGFIVFSLSSLSAAFQRCKVSFAIVLCNWQLLANQQDGADEADSTLVLKDYKKRPPYYSPFVTPSVSAPPLLFHSAVSLYSGEKFDSSLLSQIKRNRYSMIQCSMSRKALKAQCCIDFYNLLSGSGDASEVSRTLSESRLQARIGRPRGQATAAACMHPHSFPCLLAPLEPSSR
jgi:hypothetical protein